MSLHLFAEMRKTELLTHPHRHTHYVVDVNSHSDDIPQFRMKALPRFHAFYLAISSFSSITTVCETNREIGLSLTISSVLFLR